MRDRTKIRLGAAAAALVAVLCSLPFLMRGIDLSDEGHLLAISSRLHHGEGVLYRDIATNVPPLIYQSLALGFRVFGETIETERYLGLLWIAIMAGAAFLLGAGLSGFRGGCLGSAAFLALKFVAWPHWNLFSYTEASISLASLAVALVVLEASDFRELPAAGGRRHEVQHSRTGPPPAGGRLPSKAVVFAAGGLIALAAGFKQNFALFALLAILPLFRRRRWFLPLFLLPSLVLLGILLVSARADLASFFYWNGSYFLDFSKDLRIPYPSLVPGHPLNGEFGAARSLFYFLPPTVVSWKGLFGTLLAHPHLARALVRLLYLLPPAVAVLALCRREIPLARFSLLSLVALVPLADFSHYLDAMLPGFIFLASLTLPRRQLSRLPVLAISLFAGSFLVAGALAGIASVARMTTPLDIGAKGKVFVRASQAKDLSALLAGLKREAPEGSAILALPYMPLVYFPGYRNITPLYLPFPSALRQGLEERVVEKLPKIDLVVTGGPAWPHLPKLSRSAPTLSRALAADYREAGRIGRFRLLKRRPGEEVKKAQDPHGNRRDE